jgi:hypothetical protein
MNIPQITLHAGGARPPTQPQKVRILEVLGAAPLSSVLAGLVAGRTLTEDSTVQVGDYGKFVNLAGFSLEEGVFTPKSLFVAQGPGSVVTSNYGTQVLLGLESAVFVCVGPGDLRVVASNRTSAANGGGAIVLSDVAPSNPTDGFGWFDLATGILSFWSVAAAAWIAPLNSLIPGIPAGAYFNWAGEFYVTPDGTQYYAQPA